LKKFFLPIARKDSIHFDDFCLQAHEIRLELPSLFQSRCSQEKFLWKLGLFLCFLETPKTRPCQADLGKTKPDQKNATQTKRGGEKGKTFFDKPVSGQVDRYIFPKGHPQKMANKQFPARKNRPSGKDR